MREKLSLAWKFPKKRPKKRFTHTFNFYVGKKKKLVWKDSLSEKWLLIYTTLGFPFIRGFPSHEWNETHPLTVSLVNCTSLNSFTVWKVSLKPYNFRIPVYKGVILPRMKYKPSFHDNCCQAIVQWKLSLYEK